jgi:hypothetical protein
MKYLRIIFICVVSLCGVCMSAESDIATSLKSAQEGIVLPIVTKYKEESDTKAIFLYENTLVFPYASASNALFMYYKNRFFSRDAGRKLSLLGGTILGTTLVVLPADMTLPMLMGGVFFLFGTSSDLLSDVDYLRFFGTTAMASDYFKSIYVKRQDGNDFIVFPTEERAVDILTKLAEKANKEQGLFSFVTAPEEAAFEKYVMRNTAVDMTLYQRDVSYREQLLKATNKFRSELGWPLVLASAPFLFDKKVSGYVVPYFSIGLGGSVFDLKLFEEASFFNIEYENEDYFKEIQFRQKTDSGLWFWMHFLQVAIAGTHYAMTGNAFSLGVGLLGGYQLMQDPYSVALKGDF